MSRPETIPVLSDRLGPDLVMGMGEVGRSLARTLEAGGVKVARGDLGGLVGPAPERVNVLHICFPYTASGFVETCLAYVTLFEPRLVIVHSTVPVGTTRRLGALACHSPVHGVHPYLERSLTTFAKYVGAVRPEVGWFACSHLRQAGIPAMVVTSPESSELSKLLCTAGYAWAITFCQEAERLAKAHGVPFDEVYTDWTRLYNRGFRDLDMPDVARPVLRPVPGPIGGHCLMPNLDLMGGWLADTVRLYQACRGRPPAEPRASALPVRAKTPGSDFPAEENRGSQAGGVIASIGAPPATGWLGPPRKAARRPARKAARRPARKAAAGSARKADLSPARKGARRPASGAARPAPKQRQKRGGPS